MKKAAILIAMAILAVGMIWVMSRKTNSGNPHITKVYCISSTSEKRGDILEAISMVARENKLEIVDRSSDVSRELSTLGVENNTIKIHGVMRRNGELIATFSSLGSNDKVFHISFYTEAYGDLAEDLDNAVKRAASPFRMQTVSGGAFNDSFCEG